MSREIMYRVWDGSEMHYSPDMASTQCDMAKWLEKICAIKGDVGDIVFMQYTGLRDRKNNKIFEGDIVDYSKHFIGTKQAESDRIIDKIVWCEEDGNWVFFNNANWNAAIFNDVEVIGNIYQNPQLLNPIS